MKGNEFFEDLPDYETARRRVLWGDLSEADFFETGEIHLKMILDGVEVYPEDLVLEIGSGVGRISKAFQTRFPDVVFYAVDKSQEMINFGWERSGLLLKPLWYNGVNLPFPIGMMDVAFSFLVFQHIPKDSALALLMDVSRVLCPGGRFVFNVPDFNHPIMMRDCLDFQQNEKDGKPTEYLMEYYSEGAVMQLATDADLDVESISWINPKAVISPDPALDRCHMLVRLVKP